MNSEIFHQLLLLSVCLEFTVSALVDWKKIKVVKIISIRLEYCLLTCLKLVLWHVSEVDESRNKAI